MIPKTTDDLNLRFRSDVTDPLEGVSTADPDSENLWTNWEVYEYMTDAADAVARGTKGLYKIINLAVIAGINKVSLPLYVLDIRTARLLTAGRQLFPLNQNQAMRGISWDYGLQLQNGTLSAKGTPRNFVRDRERKALFLTPQPTVADTLELQCSVTISVPLMCGMPLPFTELPDVTLMLNYMKFLAYAKQDADVIDLKRSGSFKALFDDAIIDRELDIRQQRRVPSPIAMEW